MDGTRVIYQYLAEILPVLPVGVTMRTRSQSPHPHDIKEFISGYTLSLENISAQDGG